MPTKCDFVNGVCKLAGNTITTAAGCTATAAGVAGACEVVGLGPEDPFADGCAAVLGVAFEATCKTIVDEGVSFGKAQCI
jgi:hypothetical protein